MATDEIKDWLWLIKTNKGDFFISVTGKWTQKEAAEKVRLVFGMIEVGIIAMIPRKRATGLDDARGTIYEQQEEPKNKLGFYFFAGKKLWEACGRGVEYEAELILTQKELEEKLHKK